MAQFPIRVVGIVFTLILLLAISTLLLIPAQAGEVTTASVGSDERLGGSGLLCLAIGAGAVLLAVWVWAENMWKLMRPAMVVSRRPGIQERQAAAPDTDRGSP